MDILERPVTLDTFDWLASDDTGPLRTYPIMRTMLKNSNISSKLLYFFGFRADIEVRIQTNASPFLQGLLGAGFYPLASREDANCIEDPLFDSHLFSRVNFSTCQPVYLDAASGNTGIVKIPYSSENLIYNLTQDDYPSECGSLVLYVMSTLKGPTSAEKVGVTAFARFVNIELSVPTLAPLKSGLNMGIDLLHAAQQGNVQELTRIIDSYSQIYDDIKFSAQGEIDHANSTGVVSGISDTIGKVSGALSDVPVIGTIAKPIHWISDAVSGVARMFGFSKPQDLKGAETYAAQPARGMQNSDVISRTNQMALFVDNEVAVSSDIFRSETDEMALKSLVSREGLCSSFTWKKTDANKKIIKTIQVRPNFVEDGNSLNQEFNVSMNHLTAVAQMFRYWRGTIKYRVKVVKTAYHTGRLALTFSPGTLNPGINLEMGRSYSTILDLRDSNEAMFEIPFRSTWPWKNTRARNGSFPVFSQDFSESEITTGIFSISVVNNLNSTDSVQDDVEVLVFASGGDDMAFMYPTQPEFIPGVIKSASPVFEAQSINDVDENEPSDVAEGKTKLTPVVRFEGSDAIETAKICGGEVIQSLRSLIKRYEYLGDFSQPNPPTSSLSVNPFYIPTLYNGVPSPSHVETSMFVYISAFFRVCRGSTRLLSIPQLSLPTGHLRIKMKSATTIRGFLGRFDNDTSPANSTRIQSLFTNDVAEDTVPFYCPSQYMVMSRKSSAGRVQNEPKVPYLTYEYPPGQMPTMYVYRAAGDDFSFGIAGPLPVYHSRKAS